MYIYVYLKKNVKMNMGINFWKKNFLYMCMYYGLLGCLYVVI